jgi:deazaflavin-dependent oxidoreductase (nitroreductase family)
MTTVNDFNQFNQNLIEEFRTHDGKVTGVFEGAPLLLLTTTGAKTGRKHTTPLVYFQDGDRIVVFGSKGGAPTHPAWYHNLVANPDVTVELPGETLEARAVTADGAERDRIWSAQKELMPGFKDYEAKTDRQIPVVVLERASS